MQNREAADVEWMQNRMAQALAKMAGMGRQGLSWPDFLRRMASEMRAVADDLDARAADDGTLN